MRETVSPAGDPAWLVDDYNTVKALLADPRLSRFSHPDPATAPRFTGSEMVGSPLHDMNLDDLREQAIREFIAPSVQHQRLQELNALVATQVEQYITRMKTMDGPVEIRSAIAYPVPAGVISTLIGLPQDRHDEARELAYDAGNIVHSEVARAASSELSKLFLDAMNQSEGMDAETDNIIGRVNRALGSGTYSAFTREQFAEMLKGVQIAGQMNAATAIERGLILLLSQGPELDRARLTSDRHYRSRVVEEILRCPHPIFRRNSGVPRYVLQSVLVGDQKASVGDLMILDFEGANADENVFERPCEFDPERRSIRNLTFGYGRHYCIGAPLARMEIDMVLERLFSEFPNIRVVNDGYKRCVNQLSGGVEELHVDW